MYTTELADGLSAIQEASPTAKFDLIGMDLCYGSMVETLTQTKDLGRSWVGSEGLVPTNGWRYDLVLPAIRDLADRSPVHVATSIVDSFHTAYQNLANSTISALDLSKVQALNDAWNDWSSRATSALTTATLRANVRSTLFLDATGFYTTPGDLNLDMGEVTTRTKAVVAGLDDTLVKQSLANIVVAQYSNYATPTSGVSVHFVPLDDRGNYVLPHDDAYIQGKGAASTPLFVTTSTWVPTTTGTGFLDTIWYKTY
jgi:hypothetical protein